MDITATVKRFIIEDFAPDLDPAELDPDDDLLDSEILDSLGLLTVLAWIEDLLGFEIDASAIDGDDLRSVSAICSLIDHSKTTQTVGSPR